jgi:sugar/nucleoside kinase (ribokinase family)
MLDILTIGDTAQDVFLEMGRDEAHIHCRHRPDDCELCFSYREKIPVAALHHSVGGNAANAAVALARLGFAAGIYTHIGADIAADTILRTLTQNRVSTRFVAKDRDKETNYSTILNTHGERTILSYHVPRQYRLPEMPAVKWIYLTSMKEGGDHVYPELLSYLLRQNPGLTFQPGTHQIRQGPKVAREILRHCTLLIMNVEEAEQYTQKEGASPTQLLDTLRKLGPTNVVITDGARGTYATDGAAHWYLGVIPDLKLREATGAGDAYASGVTAALLDRQPLPEALRWGQVQAGSVIQQIGAQAGLLYRKQLDQLLQDYRHHVPIPLSATTQIPTQKEEYA